MDKKTEFESRLPHILTLISRRKAKWNLNTVLEWEDVAQILLIRLWEKYHLYDSEKAPFENWANTVISNAITNLLRQNLFKYARPCITAGSSGGACVHNLGGRDCSWTASGKQCEECPLYAKWKRKKEAEFNIKTSISLENCIQEVQNTEHDFIDVDNAKRIIDDKIMIHFNENEKQLYRLLYIENLSMEDVGKKMKYKVQKNNKVAGYQMLLKFSRKVKILAKQIIDENELA